MDVTSDAVMKVIDLTEEQREKLSEVLTHMQTAVDCVPDNYAGQRYRDKVQEAVMWATSAFFAVRSEELRANKPPKATH